MSYIETQNLERNGLSDKSKSSLDNIFEVQFRSDNTRMASDVESRDKASQNQQNLAEVNSRLAQLDHNDVDYETKKAKLEKEVAETEKENLVNGFGNAIATGFKNLTSGNWLRGFAERITNVKADEDSNIITKGASKIAEKIRGKEPKAPEIYSNLIKTATGNYSTFDKDAIKQSLITEIKKPENLKKPGFKGMLKQLFGLGFDNVEKFVNGSDLDRKVELVLNQQIMPVMETAELATGVHQAQATKLLDNLKGALKRGLVASDFRGSGLDMIATSAVRMGIPPLGVLSGVSNFVIAREGVYSGRNNPQKVAAELAKSRARIIEDLDEKASNNNYSENENYQFLQEWSNYTPQQKEVFAREQVLNNLIEEFNERAENDAEMLEGRKKNVLKQFGYVIGRMFGKHVSDEQVKNGITDITAMFKAIQSQRAELEQIKQSNPEKYNQKFSQRSDQFIQTYSQIGAVKRTEESKKAKETLNYEGENKGENKPETKWGKFFARVGKLSAGVGLANLQEAKQAISILGTQALSTEAMGALRAGAGGIVEGSFDAVRNGDLGSVIEHPISNVSNLYRNDLGELNLRTGAINVGNKGINPIAPMATTAQYTFQMAESLDYGFFGGALGTNNLREYFNFESTASEFNIRTENGDMAKIYATSLHAANSDEVQDFIEKGYTAYTVPNVEGDEIVDYVILSNQELNSNELFQAYSRLAGSAKFLDTSGLNATQDGDEILLSGFSEGQTRQSVDGYEYYALNTNQGTLLTHEGVSGTVVKLPDGTIGVIKSSGEQGVRIQVLDENTITNFDKIDSAAMPDLVRQLELEANEKDQELVSVSSAWDENGNWDPNLVAEWKPEPVYQEPVYQEPVYQEPVYEPEPVEPAYESEIEQKPTSYAAPELAAEQPPISSDFNQVTTETGNLRGSGFGSNEDFVTTGDSGFEGDGIALQTDGEGFGGVGGDSEQSTENTALDLNAGLTSGGFGGSATEVDNPFYNSTNQVTAEGSGGSGSFNQSQTLTPDGGNNFNTANIGVGGNTGGFGGDSGDPTELNTQPNFSISSSNLSADFPAPGTNDQTLIASNPASINDINPLPTTEERNYSSEYGSFLRLQDTHQEYQEIFDELNSNPENTPEWEQKHQEAQNDLNSARDAIAKSEQLLGVELPSGNTFGETLAEIKRLEESTRYTDQAEAKNLRADLTTGSEYIEAQRARITKNQETQSWEEYNVGTHPQTNEIATNNPSVPNWNDALKQQEESQRLLDEIQKNLTQLEENGGSTEEKAKIQEQIATLNTSVSTGREVLDIEFPYGIPGKDYKTFGEVLNDLARLNNSEHAFSPEQETELRNLDAQIHQEGNPLNSYIQRQQVRIARGEGAMPFLRDAAENNGQPITGPNGLFPTTLPQNPEGAIAVEATGGVNPEGGTNQPANDTERQIGPFNSREVISHVRTLEIPSTIGGQPIPAGAVNAITDMTNENLTEGNVKAVLNQYGISENRLKQYLQNNTLEQFRDTLRTAREEQTTNVINQINQTHQAETSGARLPRVLNNLSQVEGGIYTGSSGDKRGIEQNPDGSVTFYGENGRVDMAMLPEDMNLQSLDKYGLVQDSQGNIVPDPALTSGISPKSSSQLMANAKLNRDILDGKIPNMDMIYSHLSEHERSSMTGLAIVARNISNGKGVPEGYEDVVFNNGVSAKQLEEMYNSGQIDKATLENIDNSKINTAVTGLSSHITEEGSFVVAPGMVSFVAKTEKGVTVLTEGKMETVSLAQALKMAEKVDNTEQRQKLINEINSTPSESNRPVVTQNGDKLTITLPGATLNVTDGGTSETHDLNIMTQYGAKRISITPEEAETLRNNPESARQILENKLGKNNEVLVGKTFDTQDSLSKENLNITTSEGEINVLDVLAKNHNLGFVNDGRNQAIEDNTPATTAYTAALSNPNLPLETKRALLQSVREYRNNPNQFSQEVQAFLKEVDSGLRGDALGIERSGIKGSEEIVESFKEEGKLNKIIRNNANSILTKIERGESVTEKDIADLARGRDYNAIRAAKKAIDVRNLENESFETVNSILVAGGAKDNEINRFKNLSRQLISLRNQQNIYSRDEDNPTNTKVKRIENELNNLIEKYNSTNSEIKQFHDVIGAGSTGQSDHVEINRLKISKDGIGSEHINAYQYTNPQGQDGQNSYSTQEAINNQEGTITKTSFNALVGYIGNVPIPLAGGSKTTQEISGIPEDTDINPNLLMKPKTQIGILKGVASVLNKNMAVIGVSHRGLTAETEGSSSSLNLTGAANRFVNDALNDPEIRNSVSEYTSPRHQNNRSEAFDKAFLDKAVKAEDGTYTLTLNGTKYSNLTPNEVKALAGYAKSATTTIEANRSGLTTGMNSVPLENITINTSFAGTNSIEPNAMQGIVARLNQDNQAALQAAENFVRSNPNIDTSGGQQMTASELQAKLGPLLGYAQYREGTGGTIPGPANAHLEGNSSLLSPNQNITYLGPRTVNGQTIHVGYDAACDNLLAYAEVGLTELRGALATNQQHSHAYIEKPKVDRDAKLTNEIVKTDTELAAGIHRAQKPDQNNNNENKDNSKNNNNNTPNDSSTNTNTTPNDQTTELTTPERTPELPTTNPNPNPVPTPETTPNLPPQGNHVVVQDFNPNVYNPTQTASLPQNPSSVIPITNPDLSVPPPAIQPVAQTPTTIPVTNQVVQPPIPAIQPVAQTPTTIPVTNQVVQPPIPAIQPVNSITTGSSTAAELGSPLPAAPPVNNIVSTAGLIAERAISTAVPQAIGVPF